MFAHIPDPREGALTKAHAREAAYRHLIRDGIDQLQPTAKQQAWLNGVFGFHATASEPLLSNLPLRLASSEILIDLAITHWHARPLQRRYFFVTLFDDTGYASDRLPIVNLAAVRRKVDKALRRGPLNAIAIIEVQAIMNYPAGGLGRTLLFHTHALAWTDDPRFSPADWVDAINNSRSWSCRLGAPPADVRPIAPTAADIATTVGYMSKLPNSVKNRMPDHKRPGRHILMETTEGYRPELALRLGEGLSQILLRDAVFGVGDGRIIREAWRKAITAWHRAHQHNIRLAGDRAAVAAAWAQLRIKAGSRRYQPYQFLR